jgi:PAS domain-containing protein
VTLPLSAISDFVYTIDTVGRFTYANRPLLHLLGITLEEIVGKTLNDLPYPQELAIVEAMQMIPEDAGYEVLLATDGQAVLEMREGMPAVLLLDIWLAGVDGKVLFCFSPFGGLADALVPVLGRVAPPEALGIAFERKANLWRLFRTLGT